jgi:hypothetical protein
MVIALYRKIGAGAIASFLPEKDLEGFRKPLKASPMIRIGESVI